MRIRKIFACLSLLLLPLLLTACSNRTNFRVNTAVTLVEQEYSLAFRNDDPLRDYVVAAIETLNAEGRVAELSQKWLGRDIVAFGKNAEALGKLEEAEPHTLLVGVDINSFPMAYMQDGNYWGFDVELASEVCKRLGWELKVLPIEKENVYIELYSGNIDVAWGGIALDQKELDAHKYTQYGPYLENDIVIVSRDGSRINSASSLRNRNLAMPTTPEATAALETQPKLMERLGQITRLPGGTAECFAALYAGECDAVLTDSAAMMYFNSH